MKPTYTNHHFLNLASSLMQALLPICLGLSGLFLLTNRVLAQNVTPHFTIILNQVRGSECCGPGNLEMFRAQLAQLEDNDLSANFALRYDVLSDDQYLSTVVEHSNYDYGALLEIVPSLARSAGVVYGGNDQNWYEAQHIFLIGYSQGDRQKLIDEYMKKYHQVLGEYPKFSSAWMIDAWSLKYLKSRYGVSAHQITREQFGTDSYTLYGGPVHYPYWPTVNWAMVPQTAQTQMPLIVRQTIMDPVYCYGDKTDSYTSQPNDYLLRNVGTEYFEHLFIQAHNQPNFYTFALVGLENSMPESAQQEFFAQLKVIADWQQLGQSNQVVSLDEFEVWLNNNRINQDKLTVYQGESQTDSGEKAWWINTPQYRARIRLSAGQLAITDLRLYNASMTDPYLKSQASSLGWWIVPFVLDSSRMRVGESDWLNVSNDYQLHRPVELGMPTKLVIQNQVMDLWTARVDQKFNFYDQDKLIVSVDENTITTDQPLDLPVDSDSLNPIQNLKWDNLWGFRQVGWVLEAFTNPVNLDQVRQDQKQLLFPQVEFDPLDAKTSYLYVNNALAVAGRNPVRLVFFPKNQQGESIFLSEYPQVNTSQTIDEIALYEQHGSNGMLFIDLNHSQPLKTKVTVSQFGFTDSVDIYFAPNCKQQPFYCLLHPRQAIWYMRSFVADKIREQTALNQKQEQYVE
ncbi:MAG: hypothetical protein ABIJ03_00615 [Patescibacteria group bacterium]